MSQQGTPNLLSIIFRDLISVGRWNLLALILILVSAMSVVWITHHTRQAITQKDMALEQRLKLDEQWRNLILEESALAEHSRVTKLAVSELEMKRPDSNKEVIVRFP
ncbi:cell division protein FtsL [Vibrio ulleungensis]|uniref:Cell division protein FtsL n=1 Tax=Vibrio ulleungensis TaxID=2807619 RepID=A0ABS2HIZ1_9VIBR|nr:cell division protein FtsL [Vibrio ulleungensis]MBM7037485.1 cell division protein FtsL [Vibrio ulleungensis]